MLTLRTAGPPPAPRPPRRRPAACAAHLLPPRGSLVGEVKGGRPSRPPRKQRVPVPTFGLQERNRPGSKLRAEGGAGLTTTPATQRPCPPRCGPAPRKLPPDPAQVTGAAPSAAPLTACSSSRLSLESSVLCVDSAARTPPPSVTLVSFSPSVGGTWGVTGVQAPAPTWLGQEGQGCRPPNAP